MNYKAIAWVLLLLPHRYICTEVSEELNQNLYDALCQAECLAEGENSQCAPTQPCTTCSPLHLRELNFRRNETLTIVPQLFCKTHRAITIYWESAKLLVFLLETRGNGTQWTTATMTSCSKWTMNLLKPNSDYQMRLWGVSAIGEVFGPYESAWIRTTPTSYTPLQVPELIILDAQLVEKHYTALVEWKPAEDRSCFYNLVWYGNDERTMQNVQEREIREVDTLFRYRITGLELGTEYTIKIISINGIITRESNSTELSYHTPSCLDEFNSLEVCVPPAPEDLNATEELSSDDDYFNRTYRYNVQVTWSKPALFPDNYTVTINSLSTSPESKIVDGNETCATFFDVPLEPTYFIYIKASSRAGDGFADTEKRIASVKPPRSRSSQLPVIIGSVLGAIAIAIIVFLLLYRRYKISKSKRIRKLPISNCYGDDLKGKCLSEIGSAPGEYYVPEMINDEWQLKANQIVVDEILGEGAFGVVHKGYIKMVDGREVEVAIKMLKGNPNAEEVKQFEHEIEIMKSVGSHPHLVSLVGCCSKLGYLGPFLVVEYCVKGDLLSYLRAVWEHLAGQPLKSRYINTPCFVENNQMDNNFSNKIYLLGDDFILDPRDLLSFARQIALGMEYLSGLRVVHRDLALRNVLMCENKIVKVADFGLSRDVYQDNVYLKTGAGKLPIKWMALESLSHQQYTTQSDVWSFGVVLWEIVTLGGNPYATISPRDMLSVLRSGYRMECPKNCSLELYGIMRQCWKDSAKERPTFHDLRIMLEKLLESDNRYVSLDI